MNLHRLLARCAEAGLTEAERETLALKLAGLTDVEIARTVGISDRGVRYRISNAIGKLAEVSTTDQAAGQEPPDA